MMRLLTKRVVLYVVSAFLALFFVLSLRSSPSRPKKVLDEKCNVPVEMQKNLRAVMGDTDRLLKQLRLTHVLCYGTLWGVLKMGHLLPWEDNVEMCVLNDELSAFEEATLIRTFRRNGLSFEYNSQDGVYDVYAAELGRGMGVVRLVVFERDPRQDMMKRVGWSRRVLPPDCDVSPSLHCFPTRLFESPLPTTVMDNVQYEVPREEIEIQKYLYPDTWWKNEKPEEC